MAKGHSYGVSCSSVLRHLRLCPWGAALLLQWVLLQATRRFRKSSTFRYGILIGIRQYMGGGDVVLRLSKAVSFFYRRLFQIQHLLKASLLSCTPFPYLDSFNTYSICLATLDSFLAQHLSICPERFVGDSLSHTSLARLAQGSDSSDSCILALMILSFHLAFLTVTLLLV